MLVWVWVSVCGCERKRDCVCGFVSVWVCVGVSVCVGGVCGFGCVGVWRCGSLCE